MIELLWILSLVEGEMKEISEAEMLKRLNLLTNTSKNQISAQLRLQAAFERKKFTTEKRRSDSR
jgi:polyribonucleotide nucleotidyltransferase